MDKIKETLKRIAELDIIVTEDNLPHEAAGGNYDDAYSCGLEDGRIYLARELLAELEKK